MQSTFITVYIILSYEPLHTTNQLQWCGVFGERHEESHTAMSNTVVCPKYTTIGGWARNHLGGGGGGGG